MYEASVGSQTFTYEKKSPFLGYLNNIKTQKMYNNPN
jgi:hypothetical protein